MAGIDAKAHTLNCGGGGGDLKKIFFTEGQ